MIIREQRQEEAVQAYLNSVDGKSIIYACPRFGKIKVAIDIMQKLNISRPLILAPRNDIFKGWNDDFSKFEMNDLDFIPEYCTFTSIKKLKSPAPWDLVIIDEPHELSVNQQTFLKPIVQMFPTLGLTGTMTQKTRTELYDNLNLDVCFEYSISQGVKEGILTDYTIYLHKIPMDNTYKIYGKSKKTEKEYFDSLDYVRSESDHLTAHVMMLKQINFIQNSGSKRLKTIELLRQFKDERVLVFCGVTEVADNLGIPVYHSKAKEKEIFLKFCSGNGIDHLATIKMMQAGVTVNPINKGVINYMSGNPEDSAQKICRFLGFEYNNPLKKAELHLISTDHPFETSRLSTGLRFFESNKIITV